MCVYQLLLLLLLLFWEREWVHSSDGWRAERDRMSGRHHRQREAQSGALSHHPGIMTWAEIKSQMLKRLNHPIAPIDEYIGQWSISLFLQFIRFLGITYCFNFLTMPHNHWHNCFKCIKDNHSLGKFLRKLAIRRGFPFHSCSFQEKKSARVKVI